MRRAEIAYWCGIAFGLLFLVILGPFERRIELAHINDFSGLWSGARAVVLGIDPYEQHAWRAFVESSGVHDSGALVNDYFPWVSLALLPFGLVTVETAGWIWMVLTLGLAALGLRALLRAYLPDRTAAHGVFGAALLVTQPGFHSFVLGQWAFLLLAAVSAAAVALRTGHPRRAGLAALAFLLKPHLFVFTALRFAAERGVARVAIVGGVVVVAVSTALFPQWIGAWLSDVGPVRIIRSAALPVALADVAGPAGTLIAYGLIAAGLVLAVRSFGLHGDASLAVWLALSSAGAIYTWSYDHLLLLVPLAIAASVLLARDRPRRARAVVVGGLGTLLVLSPLLYALAVARHRESFSALIPVLIFGLIVVALWPCRRPA